MRLRGAQGGTQRGSGRDSEGLRVRLGGAQGGASRGAQGETQRGSGRDSGAQGETHKGSGRSL